MQLSAQIAKIEFPKCPARRSRTDHLPYLATNRRGLRSFAKPRNYGTAFIEGSEIDVNYVRDSPTAIYQYDVAADDIIVIAAGWGWQLRHQVHRNRVRAVTPIVVEHESDLQTRFPIGREPVFIAEADHRMIVMFFRPAADGFALVIVKLRMLVVPMMLVLFLRVDSGAAEHSEESHRANCY